MNYTKGRVNKRGYKRMGVYRGGSSRGHARTPRGSSKNLKQGLIIPTTTANAVIHELDLEFRGDNSLDDQDYQLKVQSQTRENEFAAYIDCQLSTYDGRVHETRESVGPGLEARKAKILTEIPWAVFENPLAVATPSNEQEGFVDLSDPSGKETSLWSNTETNLKEPEVFSSHSSVVDKILSNSLTWSPNDLASLNPSNVNIRAGLDTTVNVNPQVHTGLGSASPSSSNITSVTDSCEVTPTCTATQSLTLSIPGQLDQGRWMEYLGLSKE